MMQFGKRVRMMMEKKKRNEWRKTETNCIEKLKFLGPNHLLLYFQNQKIGSKGPCFLLEKALTLVSPCYCLYNCRWLKSRLFHLPDNRHGIPTFTMQKKKNPILMVKSLHVVS